MVWLSSCDVPGPNTVTLVNAQPIYTPQWLFWGCDGYVYGLMWPVYHCSHPIWLFDPPADATLCLLEPICKAGPGTLCGALQFLAGLEMIFLSRERLLENARGWMDLLRT